MPWGGLIGIERHHVAKNALDVVKLGAVVNALSKVKRLIQNFHNTVV